jgi:hypothetical protein
MFAYQPEPEIVETRKVDGWRFQRPSPTRVVRRTPCDDEVSEWFSSEWADDVVIVVSKGTVPRLTVRQRFLDLAQQWEDETGHLSSPNQKMLHPSYKAILGMGQEHKEEMIDLLIEDMKTNRRQWFWALSYLAQANPIKPEDAGRIDRMINAWVRWGETRPRR